MKLKYSYKTFPMEIISGVMRSLASGANAAKYEFTLANFELNSDAELMKALTHPQAARVYFLSLRRQNHRFADTAESVSGRVDLTEGAKSIKENFTAKLPARK